MSEPTNLLRHDNPTGTAGQQAHDRRTGAVQLPPFVERRLRRHEAALLPDPQQQEDRPAPHKLDVDEKHHAILGGAVIGGGIGFAAYVVPNVLLSALYTGAPCWCLAPASVPSAP